MKVPNPVRYATPYGGRLVWKLPGSTKIICHLKDENKIRKKKRWSQIMYMYYFLGYRLDVNKNLTDAQKKARKQNTFLLALDGDVDFQVNFTFLELIYGRTLRGTTFNKIVCYLLRGIIEIGRAVVLALFPHIKRIYLGRAK